MQAPTQADSSGQCAMPVVASGPEGALDSALERIARLAAQFFKVAACRITLVDPSGSLRRSGYGGAPARAPDADLLCSRAIASGKLLLVEDLQADPRYAGHSLLVGSPKMRFYAGQPIHDTAGRSLGTLCLLHSAPRQLHAAEEAALADFAQLVVEAEPPDAANMAQRRQDAGRRHDDHHRAMVESSDHAFIGVDAAGVVIRWNRAAEEMFGWSAAEAMGASLTATIIPREHPYSQPHTLQSFLLEAGADRAKRRLELPALTKDGATISVEMTLSPYTVESGNFFGAFVHDVKERHAAAAVLQEKRSLLDAVLASVDVGVVACDANGNITLFNRAALEFHGVDPGVVGTKGWAGQFDLYRADGVTALAPHELPLSRALAGDVVANAELTLVARGREPRFMFASGQRLLGSGGEILGAVVALKDVTELKASETARAVNESRLRAITENLPSMIGHADQNETVLYLNDHGLRYYGGTREELIGRSIRSLYRSEQYEALKPYIDRARAGRRAGFEDRVMMDGAMRYFSVVYVPEVKGGAQPCGFFVMATDITALKTSEIAHAESEERLRIIADNLPVLIAEIDSDERYRFANATHLRWYGTAPDAMIGNTVRSVSGPDAYAASQPYLATLMAGSPIRYQIEQNAMGQTRMTEVAGIPQIKDGVVVGAYLMTTDITSAKLHEEQLQMLARADALTGLANRRSYEERLREAALRSIRADRALALLFLDIDFFKQINDTIGHAGGDEVLKEFAVRLRSAVRSTDTVCRLAGDEFTIILEGLLDVDDAIRVVEKILAKVREPFLAEGTYRKVTTSIGLAYQLATEIDPEQLPKRADAALYRAKEAGRDGYAIDNGA